ncbi:MAG: ABC transporter permease [Chloroflexi bacterium]|nr:ABC transporter permease [Chloroflexota bacterium]
MAQPVPHDAGIAVRGPGAVVRVPRVPRRVGPGGVHRDRGVDRSDPAGPDHRGACDREAAVLLQRTRLGAHLLASGGHPGVARLAGVRVGRSLMAAYIICSSLAGLAGLAGLYLAARTRTGDPLIGQGFTLDSVAAVVLGGSQLAGGRVTLFGTLIGTVCLGLLPNVLNLTGVPYFYQQPVKGLLLIVAVLVPAAINQLDRHRKRVRAADRLAAESLPAGSIG